MLLIFYNQPNNKQVRVYWIVLTLVLLRLFSINLLGLKDPAGFIIFIENLPRFQTQQVLQSSSKTCRVFQTQQVCF
jgi:hypothetical protein